jgi:hypothetical protein
MTPPFLKSAGFTGLGYPAGSEAHTQRQHKLLKAF